ncbi:helix-turn-helix transcriptional regulator [Streptomyces anulatus]|uniref:helix-turn-helix transcriptional regulator n=1 Tax=Streptomyces anulatus TaxID=1892 RepID=UPI0033C193C3|nr:helix-turn-helix transcriptional regulator [Streptomyces anulatus]
MPVTLSMTTRAPITPLSPAQHRVAQLLVEGLSPQQIATRNALAIETIRQYVRDIRRCLHLPPRCKPHVLVHFVLAAEQVTPPATEQSAPVLTEKQGLLLRAVAEHSAPRDVALAAKIAPADLRTALYELLDTTGAEAVTQLVVLAHAWGLLGANSAGTVESGAVR